MSSKASGRPRAIAQRPVPGVPSARPESDQSDQSAPPDRSILFAQPLVFANYAEISKPLPHRGLRIPTSHHVRIGIPARHLRERTSVDNEEAGQHGSQEHRTEAAHDSDDEAPAEDSPAFLGSSSAVGFMSEVYQTFKSSDGAGSSHDTGDRMSHEGKVPYTHCGLGARGPAILKLSLCWRILWFHQEKLPIAYSITTGGAHPLQPFLHRGIFMKRQVHCTHLLIHIQQRHGCIFKI